jgi:hypothetical protein
MRFRDWDKKNEGMGFIQQLDYQKKGKGKDTKMSKSVDTPKDINKAVTMLVKGNQKKIDDEYKKDYPNLKPPILLIKKGKRYYKIIRKEQFGSGTSVHAFVDAKEGPTFGDILKPAGWNAPAKHARGNVFDGSWGVNSVGVYGPAYLK